MVGRACIAAAALALLASIGAESAAASETVELSPVIDCDIETSPSGSSGSCTRTVLSAGIQRSTPRTEYRTLIRFPVGHIPPGSRILAAYLWTTPVQTDTWQDHHVGVHGITTSWSSTVTWNSRDGVQPWSTPGGDIGPMIDSALPCCGGSTWDVKPLVDDWVSGGVPNHGLLLAGTAEETWQSVGGFNSSEAPGGPRLWINYEPPSTETPDIDLSGELADAAHEPLTGDDYALIVDAEDAGSGVRSIDVTLDGVPVAHAEDECPELACALDLDWDFRRADYPQPGPHHIVVTARNWAGQVASATLDFVLSATRTPPPDASEGEAAVPLSQDTSTPQRGAGPGCREEFDLARTHQALRYRHAFTVGGAETTAFYDDGSYLVARCDAMGRLLHSQLVVPVAVPSGTAMLVISETVRTPSGDLVMHEALFGSPDDPYVQRLWAAKRELILRDVLPPTQ